MTATLRQAFFLAGMPSGFEIRITQATTYGPRGFNVTWRDPKNFNISKVAASCFGGGMSLPLNDRPTFGPTCTRASDFKASLGADGTPVQLGEMTWGKTTIEHWYNAFVPGDPGAIELKFEIADIKSNKKVAGGSLTATPEKFHILQRPDNIKVELVWDNGEKKTTTTSVAADIGVDPPSIHISFTMDEKKKSLGMGFKQVQSRLNKVASLGVGLVLDVNKALVEWGVPGGAVIVTAIELPETVDTVMSFAENSKKLAQALVAGNKGQAHLAFMSMIKNGYDIGSALMNIKGMRSDVADKVVKMIPPGAKDLSEGVLTKFAERAVDALLSVESGIVDPEAAKRLRRRKLARARRYESYA
ncbi:hypothetical protein TWF481_007795 [Arthrobotrys musiformis]|uniref:Uncharacterized protein n=1 Tax=Arthrobotrys musiformis TaxID=47236 RepID=A0AAV9W5D5_9PEZI